jgi:DoxX-like protein
MRDEATSANSVHRGSAAFVWIGRSLTGLAAAFFVMDGTMKLIQPQFVIDATRGIRWPTDTVTLTVLGVLLLACTILYLVPRTAVLGAILLTGYLGGAVASHARLGDPLLTHVLFGVYMGIFVWGGLWMRNPRVRALIPISQ